MVCIACPAPAQVAALYFGALLARDFAPVRVGCIGFGGPGRPIPRGAARPAPAPRPRHSRCAPRRWPRAPGPALPFSLRPASGPRASARATMDPVPFNAACACHHTPFAAFRHPHTAIHTRAAARARPLGAGPPRPRSGDHATLPCSRRRRRWRRCALARLTPAGCAARHGPLRRRPLSGVTQHSHTNAGAPARPLRGRSLLGPLGDRILIPWTVTLAPRGPAAAAWARRRGARWPRQPQRRRDWGCVRGPGPAGPCPAAYACPRQPHLERHPVADTTPVV
jgi:hypothetical protein